MRAGLVVVVLSLGMRGEGVLAQEARVEPASGVETWSVAVSGEEGSAAWKEAKAGALLGLERLRADIQMLSALKVLQSRLLAWNAALAASGAGPVSLEAALCEEAEVRVWCGLLPATFGRVEGDG